MTVIKNKKIQRKADNKFVFQKLYNLVKKKICLNLIRIVHITADIFNTICEMKGFQISVRVENTIKYTNNSCDCNTYCFGFLTARCFPEKYFYGPLSS